MNEKVDEWKGNARFNFNVNEQHNSQHGYPWRQWAIIRSLTISPSLYLINDHCSSVFVYNKCKIKTLTLSDMSTSFVRARDPGASNRISATKWMSPIFPKVFAYTIYHLWNPNCVKLKITVIVVLKQSIFYSRSLGKSVKLEVPIRVTKNRKNCLRA